MICRLCDRLNLLYLLDLLVKASNHLISGVWHLLHHHQAHQGVHLVHKFHDNFRNRVMIISGIEKYLSQKEILDIFGFTLFGKILCRV